MEPSGDKAGDLGRRVSTRASVRVSVDNGDDEYELALAGMVADGFRPSHAGGPGEPSTPSLTSASSATLYAEDSPSPSQSTPRTGRPSSTSKPPNPQYVLSVRPEPNQLARQTTNSTDSTLFLPAEGPYQGPSGPAHPYQMYPQNVRPARTMSTTTASTVPVSESSYRGPRGPTHPYGLYPQSGSIEPDEVQTTAIPLGFRGLPDQYQRRVGPEGEEIADMIGPDGHTEQLPPYTRYPDEAYARKAAAMDSSPAEGRGGATVVPPVDTTPASAIPAISGAGGLGLATRNPEFESTDDLGSPRSRHSTRSFTSDDSGRQIRLTDGEVSEKRQPQKKWQVWMRRKVWGIFPYWAICLTGLVLLVMVIILGAVVGTVMSKQKRPPRKEGAWEPSSFDTTPIPTPSDLQPLPTGTFAMPLLPNRVSSTCFQNPTLSQAWNCNLVISGMHLTVLKEGNEYRASLDCNRSYTLVNNVYSYGEQPPLIEKPVTLDLVGDKFEPSRGPAWFKMLTYNKTVIVPEGVLGSSSGSTNAQQVARHAGAVNSGISNFKRMGILKRGEKPWVCTWPNTYLELFIYAQQNSSYSNWPKSLSMPFSFSSTQSTASSSTTSPPSPRTPGEGPDSHTSQTTSYPPPPPPGSQNEGPNAGSSSKYRGYYPPNRGPESTSSSAGTTTLPSTSSTLSPDSSSSSFSSSFSSSTTDTTTASTTSTGPWGPIDTGENYVPLPQPYPRVIKLEERRISTANAPRAQCTQVEIQGPRQEAKVLLDPEGKPIVIDIEETGPFIMSGAPTPTATAGVARRDETYYQNFGEGVFARGEGSGSSGVPDISPCGCMWYLT